MSDWWGVIVKRLWLLLSIVLACALIAGCSSNATSKSSSTKLVTTTTVAKVDGHAYTTMALDAHATTAKARMPKVVAGEIADHIKDGDVEGKDYIDIRNVEPTFVGYEIIAWRASSGAQVQYVEIEYLNGHIAPSLGSPESEMSSAPELGTFDKANVRGIPSSPSKGELAAVDAAQKKLAELLPGQKWSWGIKRYLFLYAKGGSGMVMGTTLDGELGVYSGVIKLAAH